VIANEVYLTGCGLDVTVPRAGFGAYSHFLSRFLANSNLHQNLTDLCEKQRPFENVTERFQIQ
jgi:hypothetical protein